MTRTTTNAVATTTTMPPASAPPRVRGQGLWAALVVAAAVTAVVVVARSASGLWTTGLVLGAAVASPVWEVAIAARMPRLVGGGLAAGSVGLLIIVVEGVVEASVYGVVVGGVAAMLASASFRYAEHVLAAMPSTSITRALIGRVVVPWRDLFLALAGEPLHAPVDVHGRSLPRRSSRTTP